MSTDTAATVAPAAARRRRFRSPAVRRVSMLLCALLLAGLMVVQPVARAQAVAWLWPIVSWGASALGRSALPNIAGAAARSFAFTTPARAVTVAGARIAPSVPGGATAYNWGHIALNAGAIALLGVAPFALGVVENDDEPWIELGAGGDAVEEFDDYVNSQAGSASFQPPARAEGTACWVELRSTTWGWNTAAGRWELRVELAGGASGMPQWGIDPYSTTDENYRYGICDNWGTSTANPFYTGSTSLVNIQTGETLTTGPRASTASWTQTRSGTDWTTVGVLVHPSSYSLGSGWHTLSLAAKYTPSGGQAAWYPTIDWQPFVNPYNPDGTEAPGQSMVGEPYYGVRDCLDEFGNTDRVVVEGRAGLPIPGPCPEGMWSTGYGVFQGDPDNGGVLLYSAGTTPNWHLDESGVPLYDGCVGDDGSSLGICELSVSVDGRTCAYGVVGCAGWMELSDQSRVVCHWGRHTMPSADDCSMLRYAYSTPYGVQVPQMVDSPPTEWVPGIGPDAPMQPYPLPVIDPGGTPWPDPGTNPPPATDPPGAGSLPLTGTNPHLGSLSPTPAPGFDFAGCVGSSWSWNPISWVFEPIRCAFEWAFVPRPALVQDAQNLVNTQYMASPLRPLVDATGGMADAWNSSAGCEGLPFDFDAFGVAFRGRLFEACSDPWAGVATTVRNILSGVILAGGFLAVIRYGAGVFGFVGLGAGLGDDQSSGKGSGVRFK